ncbi:MAG: class I SAM-dependent methyltransferase [Actinomycetota bacterium]
MIGDTERKRTVAEVFDRAAPTYDSVAGSYFSYFGPRIAAAAAIPPGSTVLDVACGKGAVLLPAAENGAAIALGTDISLEMVRSARSRAEERGVDNVCTVVMDGDRLALPSGSVDVLTCAFSLHFFADIPALLSEFTRVLRSGGTIALSEWGAEDERWQWESDLIGALPGRGVTTASFQGAGDLESLSVQTGVIDVRTAVEELDVYLSSEEEWWTWKWSYSFRYVLEQLDAPTLERFKKEAFARAREMDDGDGLPLTLQAFIATGRKP